MAQLAELRPSSPMVLEGDPVAVSPNVLDPENNSASIADSEGDHERVSTFDQVRLHIFPCECGSN